MNDHDPGKERVPSENEAEFGITLANSGRRFAVRGSIVRSMGLIQGDIIVARGDTNTRGAGVSAALGAMWPGPRPGATIPYVIESPERAAIEAAVNLWNSNTSIRLVEQHGQPHFIAFVDSPDVSASPVGFQGGRQELAVAGGAPFGSIAHEIGHAIGLWHEHTRLDRDEHVRVNFDNIRFADQMNFDLVPDDTQHLTPYDFDSIMHYPSDAFRIRPEIPTIMTIPAGRAIGQRDHLSAHDVVAIARLYA